MVQPLPLSPKGWHPESVLSGPLTLVGSNSLCTGLTLRPAHTINHHPMWPSLPEPEWHLMG